MFITTVHLPFNILTNPPKQIHLSVLLVHTCPVSSGYKFRSVDDAVDGSLSDGILLLQQLDGLPQFIQLRVLYRKHGRLLILAIQLQMFSSCTMICARRCVWQHAEPFLPFALPSEWDSSVWWSCCPDSVQMLPPGEPGENKGNSKMWCAVCSLIRQAAQQNMHKNHKKM